MIQPANHLFSYVPGVQFDFRFEYITGPAGSSQPVNLTNYLPAWYITNIDGMVTEYNLGVAGHSGVFFGGTQADPTNGIIDLVLIDNDTTALLGPASYQFYLTPPGGTAIPLLTGGIVNSNPSLFVGNPPPTQVIYGGNASTMFTNAIVGGGA